MRICSIILLLSGLVFSTSAWIAALDALTYGASVGFPPFLGVLANAFAQIFFTELGVFFLIPLVLLALILAVVNLWNSAVPRVFRIFLLICFAGTGFLTVLGAQNVSSYSDIGTTAQMLFIAGLLVNAVYTILLVLNTIQTYKRG